MQRAVFVFSLSLSLPLSSARADWPEFRGPTGQGHARGRLPTAWGPDRNVAGKRDVPGSGWSSPVVCGGCVYLTTAAAVKGSPAGDLSLRAVCLDARTGKVLKQARLTGALEDYYSSPIGVDGKVYVASEAGKVVVLRAAGDWEILAINEFDSEIDATPAIAENVMYIRTRNALYAVGPPK